MDKKRVLGWGIRLIRKVFSRWRFLTLYLVFAGIALNGWYIDVAGWFSGSEDYAATIRAQYGDVNILNVVTFLIGSFVFVVYLWADVKHKRLEKMIVGDVTVKNSSVFGDTTQTTAIGDHSQSVNAQNGHVTINNITNGITEERCRNIFDEKLPVALQNYSAEAVIVAKERTFKFKQKLVPRLGEEENGFDCFADPSFQFLLIEAQKAAASSDRESDYEVLSELLVNRVKMGEDRKLHIGVNKAVTMLPFISDEQLAGMTVNLCINTVAPKSNNIIEALTALDECYQKIIGDVELPMGSGWLDSLEAGGLI